MEEDKEDIKSFLTILQATMLTVLILTAYLLIVTLKNHTISLSSFVAASFILALFYTTIASFIFSAIFNYLYKNISMLLYLVLFFFSLWALIFILQNYGGRKYDNKIPDIMDGVSESITIFLIKMIFIAIISNFLVILKNWYFSKELDSSEDLEM
jgi:hypothetical protein